MNWKVKLSTMTRIRGHYFSKMHRDCIFKIRKKSNGCVLARREEPLVAGEKTSKSSLITNVLILPILCASDRVGSTFASTMMKVLQIVAYSVIYRVSGRFLLMVLHTQTRGLSRHQRADTRPRSCNSNLMAKYRSRISRPTSISSAKMDICLSNRIRRPMKLSVS